MSVICWGFVPRTPEFWLFLAYISVVHTCFTCSGSYSRLYDLSSHVHPPQPVSALTSHRETSSMLTNYGTEIHIANTNKVIWSCSVQCGVVSGTLQLKFYHRE